MSSAVAVMKVVDYPEKNLLKLKPKCAVSTKTLVLVVIAVSLAVLAASNVTIAVVTYFNMKATHYEDAKLQPKVMRSPDTVKHHC